MRLAVREIMEGLAQAAPVLVQGGPETVFTGLSTDSRTVAQGQLFVPLVGERFDGHDFIGQAFEAGASGTLIDSSRPQAGEERPAGAVIIRVSDTLRALGFLARYWRSGAKAQVLAVSGSMGKSTVKEMVAAILSRRFRVHKNQGNFNNLIGLPLTLLEMDRDIERVVVELGVNLVGEMERLADMAWADAALLTNIGPVHLEGLGGQDGVIRAKTELWKRMKPGGIAVVNLDDEVLKEASAALPGPKVTFGTLEKSPSADVVLHQVLPDPDRGLDLILEIRGRVCETSLAAVGLFQGINAAAAAAGALALGAGPEEICDGLADFRTISQRMRLLRGRGGMTILDDSYNSNPQAMEQALATLVRLTPQGQRSVAALGQMAELGDLAPEAHREVGRAAAGKGLDLLLTMGPFAGIVVEAAREAGLKNAFEVAGPEEAAQKLAEYGNPGDLVLIKGSRVARMEDLVSLLAEARDGV